MAYSGWRYFIAVIDRFLEKLRSASAVSNELVAAVSLILMLVEQLITQDEVLLFASLLFRPFTQHAAS